MDFLRFWENKEVEKSDNIVTKLYEYFITNFVLFEESVGATQI